MNAFLHKHLIRFFRDPRVRAFGVSALFTGCVALLSAPMVVGAQSADQTSGFSGLLANLVLWIVQFLGKLLLVVINNVISIAEYNNFIDSEAVRQGWVIVRDVSNMFFILVLLVIAFGTIFRIEQYRYQKLLGKLILMAILINLSKFIAGFFIDLLQVIMLTFVNAFKDAAAGNFTTMFQLENLLKFRDTADPPSTGETLGGMIYALVLIIVALVVMVVLMVVLIIRIIMLWILVILSPLAYMLSTFPGSAKYSSQWWSMFWKHAVTGPVVAFFIWLALTVSTTSTADIVNTIGNSDERAFTTTQEEGTLAATVSEASSAENFLSYTFNVMMLVAGLIAAQQVGGIAGGFAGNALSRLQRAGGSALTAPAKIAGLPLLGAKEIAVGRGKAMRRWYEDKSPSWAQPWNVIKGAKERGEELDKMSRTAAVAKARQQWERISTGGAVVIPHLDKAEAAFEGQFAKDFSGMNKEEKAEAARHLYEGLQKSPNSPELKRRMRALIHVAANGGHLDDILQDDYFKNKATWTEQVDGKNVTRKGYADQATGKFYSRKILGNFLKNALGGADGNDQQGLRLVYELEDIGKKVKHQEYGGYSTFDTKTSKHRWLSEDEATAKAVSELAKTTGRALLGDSPHDFVSLREVRDFKRDENGNIMTDEHGRYVMEDDKDKVRTTGGDLDSRFNEKAFERAFRSQPDNRITEHTQARTANILLGGDSSIIDKQTGAMVGDKMDEDRIKHMLGEWYQAPTGFWDKVGGEGLLKFQQIDYQTGEKKGAEKNIFQLIDELAQEKGWSEEERRERVAEVAGQYNNEKKLASMSEAERELVKQLSPKKEDKDKGGNTGASGTTPSTPPPSSGPSSGGGGSRGPAPAPSTPTPAGLDRGEVTERATHSISEAQKTVEIIREESAGGPPGVHLSERALEPFANSIQDLTRALESTSAALSAPTFARLFEDNVTKLEKAMESFPENVRQKIMESLQPLRQSTETGDIRTRDDQESVVRILKEIKSNFDRNRTKDNYS